METPAEARFRLGSALHDQGRLQEAIACYGEVLALVPGHADAHNNLGSALQGLGRLEEAAASFASAVAAQPSSPYFHYNLGTVRQALGRRGDAIAAYERALALKPDLVEAHYNRANVLKDEGRLDQAIAGYARALSSRPGFAEAHNNLGWALAASGRTDEALASYQRALSLAPHLSTTHFNLAALLEGAGRHEEALASYARALSIEELPETKARFAQCLRRAAFAHSDAHLRRLAARAISEPWARPVDLAQAAIRLLKLEPGISPVLRDDPLLQALLENSPVTDVELERYLTAVRRELLDAATGVEADAPPDPSAFHYALAHQCFTNEFVFAPAGDEEARAHSLRDRLVAAFEAGGDVPALWVLAVACYFPLSSAAALERLPRERWTEPLRALWTLSAVEPSHEKTLREAMPRLTAVESGVSRSVQDQYEENPYPRWARLPPAAAPVTLQRFLRERFPAAAGMAELANGVDILVAGCGTGREPIELARQFAGARVLAVDLSIASLAYAQRKSVELGIANIEYGQGDILALGALGRTFDLISSVGVLHHLEDPAAGLRTLVSLLRPGGVMFLGLYSEAGRGAIVAARRFIAQRGYRPTPVDIRRCRQDLMALAEGDPAREVTSFVDFYTTSECRDLLFHVQEHRFTLPGVKQLLVASGLEFAGFVVDPALRARYAEQFPDDKEAIDLDRWAGLEAENPRSFAGMYLFAARIAGRGAKVA